MADLTELFAPSRVAVIGATEREGAVGRAVTSNLRKGFDGDIVPVNPNAETVLGLPCVPDIASAGDVDLAVVVVPAKIALAVVREAAEAGGVIDLTDPDVADLLDARVLLVAGYRQPGDVDELLWAADRIGERLAGVVFNSVADDVYNQLESEVVPFLESRDIPVLGVLPRVRELAGVTVADFAAELGADVLTDAPTDAYVERLSVGAMGADAALRHFRRTKDAVVVTGGDRSDIHSVALEAPGVKCLCLTGGFRPSDAMLGKSKERGVPVLSVHSDTLTTIERAEDIVHAGRTRDEETVERVRELLTDHADLHELTGND